VAHVRLCFVVQELSPSGGVSVIVSHARALAAAGHEVELVVTDGNATSQVDGLTVRSLEEARERNYDWAIATWWETAGPAFGLRARRRLAFLQSFEALFYRPEEVFERQGAAAVLGLPVDFVVVGDWMRELLAELVPEARCVTVRNGVDKAAFAPGSRGPREPHTGPLRVLVEGEPGLWFKGVGEAIEAVSAMSEPSEVTLVTPRDPTTEPANVKRVLGGLTPEQLAQVYRESDVLLKLSRVEGLGLPPLEGFHVGLPCVVTPFGGQLDYLRHGENGLVVGFDDLPGTTRTLDLLARDRALLGRLAAGAEETARDWPDPDSAGRAFSEAIERFDSLPAPEPGAGLEQLLGAFRLAQESGRRLRGRLEWTESALESARRHVHEVSVAYEYAEEQRQAAYAEVGRITSSLPYRALKRVRGRVRRKS
jgi:glycosyltransferase involved in cell wall biosynthesis